MELFAATGIPEFDMSQAKSVVPSFITSWVTYLLVASVLS